MSTLTTSRRAATTGAREMVPVVVGMAPFGLIAGIAAVEIGLPAWGASVFSVLIFAGAAQLAALELLGEGANVVVIIGTVVVINARLLLYSASLATRFGSESLARRAVMAYFLTDQAFALSVVKLNEDPHYQPRWAYYMGAGVPLWAAWQVYTVAGALAGALVPDSIPLTFAIPLVFVAFLVAAVSDRPTFAAAASSAVMAVVAADLPANLGLLAAAATGITVGYLVSRSQGVDGTGT